MAVTTTAWAPLSRRVVGLGPDDTVHDGIPAYLRGVLADWVRDTYPPPNATRSRHTLLFRLRVDDLPDPDTLTDEQLLDVIDALLSVTGQNLRRWGLPVQQADQLEELLITGGAGWRLTADKTGLTRRVDTTVTTAASTTIHTASADSADHLRSAWAAAYGPNPDPDKAYDEAVLAVEALACPLVCPNSTRRTLGTVIRDLRNQDAQWELAIGDTTGRPAGPGRLVEVLALLWEGQSRHAGSPNSRRQTQAEAEAAVHLAATLVQWLITGVLCRRTP